MHTSWGAYEINLIASVASLLFAGLWLMGWTRTRCGYMLLLCAGWLGLCLYWGLIAISAGPAPIFGRADVALMVRATLIVSIVLLALGKLALLRTAYRFRVDVEETESYGRV